MEVGTVQFQASPVTGKSLLRVSINYDNKSTMVGREIVIFEHSEIKADFTFYTRNRPVESEPDTQGASQPEIATDVPGNSEIVQLRAEIHSEILSQVNNFLEVFFEKNPESAEVKYLNIYFSRYEEGQNREEFTARAKSIIEQAYTDVKGLVGELPDIVLQTREKVMDILTIFAEGGDISEFLQTQIG